MYICFCNAVTDSDIKRAVEAGADSMQHLQSRLGVSRHCGSCACEAKRCLDKTLADQVASPKLARH